MTKRAFFTALALLCLLTAPSRHVATAAPPAASHSIVVSGTIEIEVAQYVSTGNPAKPHEYDVLYITQPLRHVLIEVWDDGAPFDTKLTTVPAQIRTDQNGYFVAVVESDEPSGMDPYIRIWATDNESIEVKGPSGAGIYTVRFSSIGTDLSSGAYTVDRVLTQSYPAGHLEAFFIFDLLANDGYRQLPARLGAWAQAQPLTVRWPQGCLQWVDNSCYTGEIQVYLEDGWDRDVLLHEYGHFILGHGLNNHIPIISACAPGFSHDAGVHLSESCAWSEGWANFFQAAIQDSPNYHNTSYERGLTSLPFDVRPRDIETPSLSDGDIPATDASHPDLRTAEMAVAAVWWDIYDVAAPSESWDVLNNSLIAPNGGIWEVMTDANHQSGFAQFWTGWKLHVGRHLCEVSTIMQENEIDLGNPQPYTISVVSSNLALGSTTVIYPTAPNCLNGKYFGADPPAWPGFTFYAFPLAPARLAYWDIAVGPYNLTNTPSLSSLILYAEGNQATTALDESLFAFNLYDYPITFTAKFLWEVFLPLLLR